MRAILALDAGTTNVKAILVDRQANVLARSSVPVAIDFPQSGWVEQSAEAVWDAARQALEGCLAQSGGHEAVALGISNQRETLVAWNRTTGEPVGPCIVWQCRRSAEICQALRQQGAEETIRAKTGLQVDPLFPSSKVQWLLENRPDVRKLARASGLAWAPWTPGWCGSSPAANGLPPIIATLPAPSCLTLQRARGTPSCSPVWGAGARPAGSSRL